MKICNTRPKATEIIVPFFWVKTTGKEDEVSMNIVWKTMEGMKVPVLMNTKKLSAQTLLLQPTKELLDKGSSSSKKRKTA